MEDRTSRCDRFTSRFSHERRVDKTTGLRQGASIRYDRRRSGSCNGIALTGDAEAGLRSEGLRPSTSFLPHWSSARRCLQTQKNVRGGIESLTSAPPAPKARRVGVSLQKNASKQVHRSWRQRIAAPRLALDSISANCIGSRALLPTPLIHETVRTIDHSCGPHL